MKAGRRRFWIAIGLAVVVVGATLGSLPRVRAEFRSTGGFVPLADEPRVRFEPGAEGPAALISRALPAAVAAVERQQGGPFPKAVVVHVCATMKSARAFGGFGSKAEPGGFVLNGRLFMAPKPTNTSERLPRVLTHELSHLHLAQALGSWRYALGLPAWFKEGLAVHVSGGGGAENVSAEEARAAIRAGRAIQPRESDGLYRTLYPKHDGLPVSLFYRQSGLFVAYLIERDEAGFRLLLAELKTGAAFPDAMRKGCGRSVAELWTEFLGALPKWGLVPAAAGPA
jgi:hypothetical protein